MSKKSKNKSARWTHHTDGGQVVDKKWFCAAWLRPVVVAPIVCCLLLADPARGAAWQEKQKLLAADGAASDYFGHSVSISGDYAIVGAFYDDDKGNNSGSAYIFKWDGPDWVQQQKLLASDGAAYDQFGVSVSISGDYAIIGADQYDSSGTGKAYIFSWDGANWVQQAKLTASDGAAGDCFGRSVSISGDYAIVGSPYDDNEKGIDAGSAYTFKRDGTDWVQQQKLTATDGAADDYFGISVSISGDYAIIGAFYDDDRGDASGAAYIFKRDGSVWSQQAKLLAADGAEHDYFGYSVSISSDYAIVGAIYDDDKGDMSGSAYIFKRSDEPNDPNWNEQQKLLAADGAANDYFSWSVSISGDFAIVGAHCDDDKGSNSGSAYIFKREDAAWLQQPKLLASDGAAGDRFGISVSISGDYAIVGARYDDDRGDASGSAYIFVPVVPGELTVLAPNGGEQLVAGSTYAITWDTNGVIENVYIEYSDNNGMSWATIDTVANTGSYPWLVPDINSEQCLVWISDANYPPAGDISDDVFRIYICTLLSDINHDCFVDFFDFSFFVSEWLQCGDPYDPNCKQ